MSQAEHERMSAEIAATLHGDTTPGTSLTGTDLLALLTANPQSTDSFVKEIFA